jgi:hypothetical protein
MLIDKDYLVSAGNILLYEVLAATITENIVY